MLAGFQPRSNSVGGVRMGVGGCVSMSFVYNTRLSFCTLEYFVVAFFFSFFDLTLKGNIDITES